MIFDARRQLNAGTDIDCKRCHRQHRGTDVGVGQAAGQYPGRGRHARKPTPVEGLAGATELSAHCCVKLEATRAGIAGGERDTVHRSVDTNGFDKRQSELRAFGIGAAVKKAADAVRWRIKLRAARLLGVEEPCSIELRDRRAWAPDGRSVSLEDIALNSLHTEDHEQIMGIGSHVSHECPPPFAAQFAEIEVDIETGQVTVVKLVMAVDCGVAINPITASGQVEGGMFQALGYAVSEEFAFDNSGRVVNAEFGPYWIFRADDAPATEVFLVQTMEDSGPFGAKAVAEIPTDGVAPAVRNALLQATGVAIDQIPFTPERVHRALHAAR